MSAGTILTILFIHWVADFLFQTEYQANNKSKNWSALVSHTATYSFVFYIGLVLHRVTFGPVYFPPLVFFTLVTFICHTLTDAVTSRVTGWCWVNKKVRWFFHVVGFDQWLHYAQLFLTYELFFNL